MIVIAIRVEDFDDVEPTMPSEKLQCADCGAECYVSHGTMQAMAAFGMSVVVCVQCANARLGSQAHEVAGGESA